MRNTAANIIHTQHTNSNPEEILPMVNENIEPVPVVQIMGHPRMDVSRAISEEELMERMRTRLKAIFA